MDYLSTLKQYLNPDQQKTLETLVNDPVKLKHYLLHGTIPIENSQGNLIKDQKELDVKNDVVADVSVGILDKESKKVIASEQGLLLDMFSEFCIDQPQNAKELSISFTKFARWMQSTVDKKINK